MKRALLLLLILLGGCRYTFWPLIPPQESYPPRVSLTGKLVEGEGQVTAVLQVRRWPEPDYLELRWYKGDELVEARSIWLEKAGEVKVELPREPDGFYRLLVLVQDRPVLQLDLGEPSLPPPPAAPGQEPGAG